MLVQVALLGGFALFGFKTAIIINKAITQSGIPGLPPGPVLGHWPSASWKNGIAIFTKAAKQVPSLARFAVVRTSS